MYYYPDKIKKKGDRFHKGPQRKKRDPYLWANWSLSHAMWREGNLNFSNERKLSSTCSNDWWIDRTWLDNGGCCRTFEKYWLLIKDQVIKLCLSKENKRVLITLFSTLLQNFYRREYGLQKRCKSVEAYCKDTRKSVTEATTKAFLLVRRYP